MVKVIIAIVCFLPMLLNAQGFGSFRHDQPFLAKDIAATTPAGPVAGTEFWWNFKDLTTNARVATWTDKIQGTNLTAATGSQVTNRTTGVVIEDDGANNYLTNIAGGAFSGVSDNFAVALILDYRAVFLPFGDEQAPIYCEANNNYLYLTHQNNGTPHALNRGSASANLGRFDTNTWADLVVSIIGGNMIVYTNGVNSFPSTAGAIPRFNAIGNLDTFPAAEHAAVLEIKDILVITNVSDAAILSSNMHYYRTNTYP